MNHQNNNNADRIHDANKATENGEQDKPSQISLPQNEESRGPFEHSGKVSRQTEEQRIEEEDEKE